MGEGSSRSVHVNNDPCLEAKDVRPGDLLKWKFDSYMRLVVDVKRTSGWDHPDRRLNEVSLLLMVNTSKNGVSLEWFSFGTWDRLEVHTLFRRAEVPLRKW